jgi:Nif-specific regulatory protein
MLDARIKVFKQLSEIVNSVIDVENLFEAIINTATRIMNAKASSLLLKDEQTGKLYFHITTGDKSEEIKRYELERGEGIAGWVAEHKQPLLVTNVKEDPRWQGRIAKEVGFETNSIACSPMMVGDKVLGVIEIIDHEDASVLTKDDLEILNVFSELAASTILKARMYSSVDRQNTRLKEELNDKMTLVGESPVFKKVLSDCSKVARSRASVLISGSCGTGKELIARYIHNASQRKEGPFVPVNCGALVETLLESELFGYEKGAFTGADRRKRGLFEAADKGSIFLDEIAETSQNMQTKLLRVLQEGTLNRVGGVTPVNVDVRVIAATNRDIEKLVEEGEFREDLYYRLNVVRIKMPNLNDRKDDIPILADYFLKKFLKNSQYETETFSEEALEAMQAYNWPGNVRQLENVVERAVIMGSGKIIQLSDLPYEVLEHKTTDVGLTLKAAQDMFKASFIKRTLETIGGSKTEAAKVLGIQRTYLSRLIKELHIGS